MCVITQLLNLLLLPCNTVSTDLLTIFSGSVTCDRSYNDTHGTDRLINYSWQTAVRKCAHRTRFSYSSSVSASMGSGGGGGDVGGGGCGAYSSHKDMRT